MTAFKVIIVGGSVAGLTLANILQLYGIDFTLLEKHELISPPLGAGIALWAHGLRIMDQIGLSEKLASMGMSFGKVKTINPDGQLLSYHKDIGDLMEEATGYRGWFLDRQQLLQTLYDNIRDKSKIHTSCELLKIKTLDGNAKIETKSGVVYRGDIVVGTDGVHSRTDRSCGGSSTRRYRVTRGDDLVKVSSSSDSGPSCPDSSGIPGITCTYRCLFGISKRPDGVPDDYAFKAFNEGRSYLSQAGTESRLYWFLFIKNPRKTTYQSIPRYNAEDGKEVVAKYADDLVLPGHTLGDVYNARLATALVPVEEFVLERCFYKRAVLVGDSFHKMNPLTGQGGNMAIESAAMLADMLKEALGRGKHLDDTVIHRGFCRYQNKRKLRTKPLMRVAQMVQRLEALDSPIFKFLSSNVVSKLESRMIIAKFVESSIPGYFLRYTPLQEKNNVVALNSQVKVTARVRSTATTIFWVILMLFISSLGYLSRYLGSDQPRSARALRLLEPYTFMMTVAINSLWAVESYRLGLFPTPLCSAIPFASASSMFGWHIILPIYFAIHIYVSRNREFYYPSPRAINVLVAKSVSTGFVVSYALPVMQAIRRMSGQHTSITPGLPMTMAHLIFPLVLRIGRRFYGERHVEIHVMQLLYGNKDLPYLSRFFTVLLCLSSITHLVFIGNLLPLFMAGEVNNFLAPTAELGQAGCLSVAIMTWCCFVLWDLRRVGIARTSFPMALSSVLLGTVFLGPAGTLVVLWRWRESAMEASRKRM